MENVPYWHLLWLDGKPFCNRDVQKYIDENRDVLELEQLKAQFEPEKPKGGRNIEFHDPNPVTEPIGTGEPVPEPTPEPERPAVPSNSKTQELLDETEF